MAVTLLTCDQALFSFRSVKHSGGKGERKLEPDTTLLGNVYYQAVFLSKKMSGVHCQLLNLSFQFLALPRCKNL